MIEKLSVPKDLLDYEKIDWDKEIKINEIIDWINNYGHAVPLAKAISEKALEVVYKSPESTSLGSIPYTTGMAGGDASKDICFCGRTYCKIHQDRKGCGKDSKPCYNIKCEDCRVKE